MTTTLATADGALELTSNGPPAPVHLDFVAEHWRGLAAAAGAGYARHGAGAVVLLSPEVEHKTGWLPGWLERLGLKKRAPQHPFKVHQMWYATRLGALPGVAVDPRGWEVEQLQTYQPEAEAVVLFIGEAPTGRRSLRAYRVRGMLRPAQALAHARASLN